MKEKEKEKLITINNALVITEQKYDVKGESQGSKRAILLTGRLYIPLVVLTMAT